jgi:signal peptidase I
MVQQKTGADAPEKKGKRLKKDRAAEIANTFEWLITAFILAFVFRAFVMEAFRIPTGSMADTLMGAHFRVRCLQCGTDYPHGYTPGRPNMKDTIPPEPTHLPPARCPSCGYEMRYTAHTPLKLPVDNGDRILVLKSLYQFVEPKRWDVIVFKNPLNPSENYIKRLIGLPNETIEIVDGDIFINGQVARKPAKVQQEQWTPIYQHDFQPIAPEEKNFNNKHSWRMPFDFGNSAWFADTQNPTQLRLESASQEMHTLTYGAPSANDFRATYAYNIASRYGQPPVASDLMVRFYATSGQTQGKIGVAIYKYGIKYSGWIDQQGEMQIKQGDTTLKQQIVAPIESAKPTEVRFAVVDRRLKLTYGSHTLSVDLDGSRHGLALKRDRTPSVHITGAGTWTLAHVALFRDIHYTSKSIHSRQGRATENHPFTLHQDEFFVLGDNSPNSEDGRWWNTPTAASRGHQAPRAGVVPRHYLVGKALFVYWPSGFAFPWPQTVQNFINDRANQNGLMRLARMLVNLRWIPNVGKMRFIYGGSRTLDPTTPEMPVQQTHEIAPGGTISMKTSHQRDIL